MDREFYITFHNHNQDVSNNPDYMYIERLISSKEAVLYYNNNVLSDFNNVIEPQPILITNNRNLYRQFRHVFNEKEFKLYCEDKLPSYSGITGIHGQEAFVHFLNIKEGVYDIAYQTRSTERWDDSQSGNSYNYTTNQRWETSCGMNDISSTAQDIEHRKTTSKDDGIELLQLWINSSFP